MRFELTTSTLARLRSTPELHPLFHVRVGSLAVPCVSSRFFWISNDYEFSKYLKIQHKIMQIWILLGLLSNENTMQIFLVRGELMHEHLSDWLFSFPFGSRSVFDRGNGLQCFQATLFR
jgi:hypothetical protein